MNLARRTLTPVLLGMFMVAGGALATGCASANDDEATRAANVSTAAPGGGTADSVELPASDADATSLGVAKWVLNAPQTGKPADILLSGVAADGTQKVAGKATFIGLTLPSAGETGEDYNNRVGQSMKVQLDVATSAGAGSPALHESVARSLRAAAAAYNSQAAPGSVGSTQSSLTLDRCLQQKDANNGFATPGECRDLVKARNEVILAGILGLGCLGAVSAIGTPLLGAIASGACYAMVASKVQNAACIGGDPVGLDAQIGVGDFQLGFINKCTCEGERNNSKPANDDLEGAVLEEFKSAGRNDAQCISCPKGSSWSSASKACLCDSTRTKVAAIKNVEKGQDEVAACEAPKGKRYRTQWKWTGPTNRAPNLKDGLQIIDVPSTTGSWFIGVNGPPTFKCVNYGYKTLRFYDAVYLFAESGGVRAQPVRDVPLSTYFDQDWLDDCSDMTLIAVDEIMP